MTAGVPPAIEHQRLGEPSGQIAPVKWSSRQQSFLLLLGFGFGLGLGFTLLA